MLKKKSDILYSFIPMVRTGSRRLMTGAELGRARCPGPLEEREQARTAGTPKGITRRAHGHQELREKNNSTITDLFLSIKNL